MIRAEERGRNIEKWQETRTVVRGRTASNVIKSMESSQEEAPPGKDVRAQLGCNAFIGGIAPGTSSGMLQSHLQRFAQEKYCALLSGTLNDKARAAKVTFTNCEERNKAMAADDSMLDGQMIRVRTWACRPQERMKEGELRKAPARNGSREPICRLAPRPRHKPKRRRNRGVKKPGSKQRSRKKGRKKRPLT